MNDDLKARLRSWPTIQISEWRKDTDMRKVESERSEAADRIEQLEVNYIEACEEVTECYVKQCIAERKLAKAMEVVEKADALFAAFYSNGNVTERHLRACNAGVAYKEARAALAELKGK